MGTYHCDAFTIYDMGAISRETSLDGDTSLRCIYYDIEAISSETSLDGDTSLRCNYHDIEAISREPVWMATYHHDIGIINEKLHVHCRLGTSIYHGIGVQCWW